MAQNNGGDPTHISRRRAKRAYRGERREEQKAATQARILDAALQLFSENGFEGTSIRTIAANAGVTHTMIGLHFGGKTQLWQAAVDHLFRRMASEMRPGPDEPAFEDGCEGMESFIRKYVRYCARHPEHARLMLQESMHDNEQLAFAVDHHIAPSHAFLQQLIEPAMQNGVMIDLPPISSGRAATSARPARAVSTTVR